MTKDWIMPVVPDREDAAPTGAEPGLLSSIGLLVMFVVLAVLSGWGLLRLIGFLLDVLRR